MKNFNAITHAHVWVLDHQEALDFYVGKLGLEVKADYTLGGFRWLTVGVEGEAVPEITLDVMSVITLPPASLESQLATVLVTRAHAAIG